MGKPIAWSHSRLSDFKKCKKLFWLKYVDPAKRIPFETSPQMEEGKKAHEALQHAVERNVNLPVKYDQWAPIVNMLKSFREQGDWFIYCENQMALNGDLKPTGWFAHDAWSRAITDVLIVSEELGIAYVFDYKTGKVKEDPEQLQLCAAQVMHHFEKVDKVRAAFIWLDLKGDNTKLGDTYEWSRESLKFMWEDILTTPKEIEEAAATDSWEPNGSTFACRYCPANKKNICRDAKDAYRGT